MVNLEPCVVCDLAVPSRHNNSENLTEGSSLLWTLRQVLVLVLVFKILCYVLSTKPHFAGLNASGISRFSSLAWQEILHKLNYVSKLKYSSITCLCSKDWNSCTTHSFSSFWIIRMVLLHSSDKWDASTIYCCSLLCSHVSSGLECKLYGWRLGSHLVTMSWCLWNKCEEVWKSILKNNAPLVFWLWRK